MMTPRELFKKIRMMHRTLITRLCDIHSLCQNGHKCLKGSHLQVINFDKVKEKYCEKTGIIHMPPSVDAITLSGDGRKICFVELKSWIKYLAYTRDVSSESIHRQLRKYKFLEKLEASMRICAEFSGENDFFDRNGYAYIIVTDADAELATDPARNFALNMFALAETSCRNWRPECVKATNDTVTGMTGVNVRHISCQQFDSVIESI